ncbi:MAG: indolepyruvate ferredoxin oxidoreductase subunit alpha, partial [Oscillospiraceae bacterium]
TTTRVCHSKGIVQCSDRVEVPIKEYVKNVSRTITVPALSRPMRIKVEARLHKLAEFAETTELNRVENKGKRVGVISSGMCYYYAREVFEDEVSYLKLGFTNPLPDKLISDFCRDLDTIYVLEENDPYIKDRVRLLGFKVQDVFPFCGEMTPDVVRKALGRGELPFENSNDAMVLGRPPMLCAGCPHRGFFYEIGKRPNLM